MKSIWSLSLLVWWWYLSPALAQDETAEPSVTLSSSPTLPPSSIEEAFECLICPAGQEITLPDMIVNLPWNSTALTCSEMQDEGYDEARCGINQPFTFVLCGCQDEPTNMLSLEQSLEPSASPTEFSCVATEDSETLRNTCKVYGSFFLVALLLFCVLRRRFIQTFAIRSWGNHKTPLANSEYGFFEWISKIARVTDEELQDECGMDGLCLVRINYFGLKMSLFAMFNAVWLLPVYGTAETTEETECMTDSIQSVSISHVPSGSSRLICATIAAYLIFGFAMYTILGELEWLKTYRHRFFSKTLARNYSVYLRCIPDEFVSNAQLMEYFNRVFEGACIESNVALKIPNLEKEVVQRDAALANLEHAINVQRATGVAPMHSVKMCGGEKVDSLITYTQELAELNEKVKDSLEKLQDDAIVSTEEVTQKPEEGDTTQKEETQVKDSLEKLQDDAIVSTEEVTQNPEEGDTTQKEETQNLKKVEKQSSFFAEMLSGNPDGEKLTAAFVSFNSLKVANAVVQLDLYDQPHAMEACEAPDPEDVMWANVGKTHKSLQIGKLISVALTTLLCLFWTAVITFAASLSSVEGLREIDFIDNALNKMPWLVPVLAQIAPFVVVAVNALLKVFLTIFSSLEFPVSVAILESSLFSKLAIFMIIQNFFVASIGGAASEMLTDLVEDPTSIIDLLATSLPAQSTFHIQILLVNVFLSMSLELLGVSRLAVAWIRQMFGPGLTEKERTSPWMGLKPLNDPDPFIHSLYTAWNVLYFMVLFVYSTIAPISSFFMALCFLIMWICFRYLFIFIYPVVPDSGGKLYFSLLKITLLIMLISEITILGLLGLKQSVVASILMIPLLIVTVLFNIYVKQQHFSIAEHLPTAKCLDVDVRKGEEGFQSDFLVGAYTQPALKSKKEVLPENLSTTSPGYPDEETP